MTPAFTLRFPDWLKEQAKQAAQAKGITLTEYIKDAVKVALIKDGFVK